MYEAFDSYLNIETWHTAHPLDNERFYRCLAKVVRDPNFNPDEMGEYMRDQKGLDRDNAHHEDFNEVIDRRVSQAWAIKYFLRLGD